MSNIDFLKKAKAIEEFIISSRRDFHQNPELGYEEYRTSKKIKEFLDSEGIEYYESAKTGICAIIKGKNSNDKKTVALRADIDALPIEEKNICEYTSKNKGKMHACGHDAHTAILMGATKILNSIKDELNGNVKLFFEPAEETTGGARVMIKEGVLENPKVDAVFGLHVEEWLSAGTIGIKKGVVNAASNPFTIKIFGKGGHGAYPHNTVDPIIIASNVIVAIQNIVSREIEPTNPAVVTVGYINGGTAQNIIPGEVKIGGIIRTMTKEDREYVCRRLVEVVEGVTKSMRGTCEIEIEESYPCLYNDDNMVDIIKKGGKDIIGEKNIINLDKPIMGVESFAYFSMERPSAFYFLGCRNEERGIINPTHNASFDIDEECLTVGVAMQVKMAYDYLNSSK
jgi:amidohydrolase